jgi:hypothetical protein
MHVGAHVAAPPASTAPSLSEARAFAHAVNLRIGDVHGFKVTTEHEEHETGAEKRLERDMLRCVGPTASAKHGLVEENSSQFGRESPSGTAGVQSEVSVEPSSALATKALAAIRAPQTRSCLAHYLELLFKGRNFTGGTLSPISIIQATPPAAGANGSFAWRLTATITAHHIAIPLYLDVLGFIDGPAEVSLMTLGVPKPFPAATEEHLFSLLLERAKARHI